MPRRSMWIVVRSLVVAACCLGAPALAAPAAAPPAGPAAEVLSRLAAIAPTTRPTVDEAGRVTGIVIQDGSGITDDDAAILGRLEDLRTLQIFDCRSIGDAAVARLAGLRRLDTLALTNSGLTDAGVEAVVQAFPDLVDLDLSSNTNMTGAALKPIAGLGRLERLSLLQNRFNDLHTRRLAKLQGLRTLDLRGNMEAGDMTLEVVGRLPALKGLKHRSTAVTDEGLDRLAASPSLEQLLLQDFAITNASGPHLARIATLTSLEIFRCQGFGSDGVLALGGLPLVRLTLRDLPDVEDRALAVLERLPRLRRLYLHELASVGDEGLRHLAAASDLEVLDVWSLPRMTDATVAVISTLPTLRELSLRETGVTEAAVERIVAMPNLRSLVFKNNGPLSAANAAKLAGRKWTKLETDAPR